jgi:hypothetical protein
LSGQRRLSCNPGGEIHFTNNKTPQNPTSIEKSLNSNDTLMRQGSFFRHGSRSLPISQVPVRNDHRHEISHSIRE